MEKHSGRYPWRGKTIRPDFSWLYKEVKKENLTGIRAYSMMNDFVDFVVYVPPKDKDLAIAAIRTASDKYWDEEDEGYYTDGYADRVYRELHAIGEELLGKTAFCILTEQDFDNRADYDYGQLPYSEAVEF